MKMHYLSSIPLMATAATLVCLPATGISATTDPLPPGTVRGNTTFAGRPFITGKIMVTVGPNKQIPISLYVIDKVNNYPGGNTPVMVYKQYEQIIKSTFEKFVNRGISPGNMKMLTDSITGIPQSGFWIEYNVPVSGYSVSEKAITISYGYQAATIAHESFHGWESQRFTTDAARLEFYKAFVGFANLYYNTSKTNPQILSAPEWKLTYMSYGLQNEMEWGSEVFTDWVLGTTSQDVWPFINKFSPQYKDYFDNLLLKDPKSLVSSLLSVGSAFDNLIGGQKPPTAGNLPVIEGPKNDPTINPPIVPGFTQRESQAIWNVAFDPYKHTATPEDFTTMDAVIKKVAPNLPGSPSRAYKLGFGDFNHDGILDWACWYAGLGPNNSTYLWNSKNTKGAYTFIVTGAADGKYAEYMQDPWYGSSGTLLQPMYRQWQGKYGLSSGARLFRDKADLTTVAPNIKLK